MRVIMITNLVKLFSGDLSEEVLNVEGLSHVNNDNILLKVGSCYSCGDSFIFIEKREEKLVKVKSLGHVIPMIEVTITGNLCHNDQGTLVKLHKKFGAITEVVKAYEGIESINVRGNLVTPLDEVNYDGII